MDAYQSTSFLLSCHGQYAHRQVYKRLFHLEWNPFKITHNTNRSKWGNEMLGENYTTCRSVPKNPDLIQGQPETARVVFPRLLRKKSVPSPRDSRPRSLSVGTIVTLGRMVLCYGGCPMHSRTFNGILASTHSMTVAFPTPQCDNPKCLHTLPNSPGGQNHSQLRTAAHTEMISANYRCNGQNK